MPYTTKSRPLSELMQAAKQFSAVKSIPGVSSLGDMMKGAVGNYKGPKLEVEQRPSEMVAQRKRLEELRKLSNGSLLYARPNNNLMRTI